MQPAVKGTAPVWLTRHLSRTLKTESLCVMNIRERFNGTCCNFGQRGHRAEDCRLPETPQFKQKLEEFRECKKRIRSVATYQSQKCHLEMTVKDGAWIQVTG